MIVSDWPCLSPTTLLTISIGGMERRQFDQSVVSAVSLMFGAAVLVYERNNKSGCLSRIFLTVLGGKKLSNFLGGEKKKSSD